MLRPKSWANVCIEYVVKLWLLLNKHHTCFHSSGSHCYHCCCHSLTCILYGTLWSLWKERNDRIFKGMNSTPTKTVDFIKSMSIQF
uniref:Uncharacterized protein n=1 Tax=Lactuca sativa TaxID=4236 RepID=A0A9R1X7A5_LACSA|nr:hypothetical protein LSAT_V11C500242560 [Lactuca sativa]